jgi:hypothetical protein
MVHILWYIYTFFGTIYHENKGKDFFYPLKSAFQKPVNLFLMRLKVFN